MKSLSPPSREGGLGHVCLHHIPSVVDAPADPFWHINHWDSNGVDETDLLATTAAVNNVSSSFLGEQSFGFTFFDPEDLCFQNGHQYFVMRRKLAFEAMVRPSCFQSGVKCIVIGFYRLFHCSLGLDVPVEVSWWEQHGVGLLAELGAIFAKKNEAAGYLPDKQFIQLPGPCALAPLPTGPFCTHACYARG